MGRKFFIAVHGIGDQTEFATVQSVARRVLGYLNQNIGDVVAFGQFASARDKVLLARVGNVDVGFAEVTWADVCRGPAGKGHVLQEPVSWLQSIVDRVEQLKKGADAVRKAMAEPVAPAPDYPLIRAVLAEMGGGLNVLGTFLSFAPKLQLPSFEIDGIMRDYLGDVQFVAEFKELRDKIVTTFRARLDTLPLQSDDEIYLITHSEGTVVTLLGLLGAMTGISKPAWLDNVRGWMTIGSPIDKHLILWPPLWEDFENAAQKHLPAKPIRWWNYYDYGDPVGFELDTVRQWIDQHKFTPAFQTSESGFSRYPLPGKAHNDYWNDRELFEHFLGNVAGLSVSGPGGQLQAPPPPRTKNVLAAISYVVPYVFALAILAGGTFLLTKGLWLAQGSNLSSKDSLGIFSLEVVALVALLAGTTVLARLPRIVPKKVTSDWNYWFTVALGVFALGSVVFWFSFPDDAICKLLDAMTPGMQQSAADPPHAGSSRMPILSSNERTYVKMGAIAIALTVALISNVLRFPGKKKRIAVVACAVVAAAFAIWVILDPPVFGLPRAATGAPVYRLIALVLVFLAALVAVVFVDHTMAGLWTLVGPGTAIIVAVGILLMFEAGTDKENKASLWPLFVGGLPFLYLWYLAAVVFDLTFVWHRYIKTSRLMNWMRTNLYQR